jgi:hypothetical protein
MNDFTSRYSDRISGVLSGFDRLVFRGNLSLNHEAGMKGYLWANGIPWKDYPGHVTAVSQQVKQTSLAAVEAAHRPIQYLSSGKDSKEQLAREIARRDGIRSGPICAFTAVEPCYSWRVAGDRDTKKLRLLRSMRQACSSISIGWMTSSVS